MLRKSTHRGIRYSSEAARADGPVLRKAIKAVEPLEGRVMLAAHILGSATVYSTIQAAVDAAAPNATITVDAGTYSELVTVNKPLTIDGAQAGVDARSNLRSNSANESIVNGALMTGGGHTSAFYIASNDVTINGFTITGCSTRSYYGAGLVIAPNEAGTHVLNNIIANNFTGLFLSNNSATDACIIQYNFFRDNYNPADTSGYQYSGNDNRCIYSDGSVSGGLLTNVTIDSNEFLYTFTPPDNVEGAIGLESYTVGSQTNIRITNNSMDGVGKGVLMYDVTGITITGNVFTRVGDIWSGVFRDEGNVQNAVIEYNDVYDAYGPALDINGRAAPGESAGFTVEYNNFYNDGESVNGSTSFTTENGYRATVLIGAGAYNGTIDLKNNYWGSASGPGGIGTGTGDPIVINNNDAVYKPFATTPVVAQEQPYFGLAWSAGAPIEAVNFDHGGAAVAYSDSDLANDGGKYRPGESVDIEATTDTGGGYNVGWTVAGEWLNYTVNLGAGGNYSIAFRVANQQSVGGTFQLDVDGQNVTGAITTPNTGGWQIWQTVTISNINISAGAHVLKLVMDANGNGGSVANFNWFELLPVNVVSAPAAPTALTATAAAIGVNLAWQQAAAASVSNYVIQRSTDGVSFTQIATCNTPYYTDAAAAANTHYVYRVYAVNGGGSSPASNTASITTPAALTAPTGLTAVAVSPTQINLNWTDTAPAVETGFLILRSTDNVNFASIGTTAKGVTTYSDATLTGGATYYYRVDATGAVGNSPGSSPASAQTPAAGSIVTPLSSLAWVSATAGWAAPLKNQSVGGNTITLHGAAYASGIGTHALSQIVYTLAGAYSNFISDIGIDAEEYTKGTGSVDFQVIGDGKVLFDSGVLTNASPTVSLNVNITGVQTLTLIASNGIANSIDYDHADWAGARLLASPNQVPAAPTNLAAVAVAANQINLAWTDPASATGFVVQRSSDGANYSTIATLGAGADNYFDASGLTAGAAYSYRIDATSAGGTSPASVAASATTLASSSAITYISSLTWTSAAAGWGSVQKDTTVVGNTIKLRGNTYARGIGTHAASQIVYNLAGAYTNFISDVGIDDEELSKGTGSVDFQVIGDGKVLFDSGVLTNTSPVVSVNVNVSGVQTLTLVATNGIANNIDYDHADWAGARLISSAPVAVGAAAPANLRALAALAPVVFGPALPASWTNATIGETGLIGSGSDSAGVFTISGAGSGIGGASDAFDYAYQSIKGNVTLVTQIDASQTGTNQSAVMIREGLGANARDVAIVLGHGSVSFQRRTKVGKAPVVTTKPLAAVPTYVKLSRKGDVFTASVSADGVHWTKLGAATIGLKNAIEVGLAVSSGSPSTLSVATFSELAITK